MVLRLFFASFLIFGTINASSYDGDEIDEEAPVEDSMPLDENSQEEDTTTTETPPLTDEETPKSTSTIISTSTTEPTNTSVEASQSQAISSTKTQSPEDIKVQDLIRTLETDTERASLVNTLKTLIQSNTLQQQQFLFMNALVGIKDFLRSVMTEFKVFANGLMQTQTWDIQIGSDVFKTSGYDRLLSLLYVCLTALFIQVIVASFLGAAAPPLFGRLDKQSDWSTVARTFMGILVFFIAAYIIKANFIEDVNNQLYVEENVLSLTLVQVGFVLLRLSIVRGILPVDLEYRKSLVRAVFIVTLLCGGYVYFKDLTLSNSETAIFPRPLSQLFFGILLIITLWVLKRYQHVIKGMLFRPLTNSNHRLFVDIQHGISLSVHYVIVIAFVFMYMAWFVNNNTMFMYFRDQLWVTLISLLVLSLASYVMESSTQHFGSGEEPNRNIAAVTYRLIDVLAFITVLHLIYRWVTPLIEMQGVSTAWLSDKLFGIFIIIALTVLVMHGLNRIFNNSQKIIGRNKQLKTFMPILDRLCKLVVIVVSGLLLLLELNINVMPIVASFSVLGLGIGLASKSIIEDFMNGVLVVQENDFNIGDKITVGGITGVIENITLRKLLLRDNHGYLNFIPFSSIGAITNQSRDYNTEKITIPLPSGFHLKRTAHILEDVGKQLLHDPELKPHLIALPKFVGISEFQVTAHQTTEIVPIMLFELTTAPEKMNIIAAEFRKLAKLAFEEIEKLR